MGHEIGYHYEDVSSMAERQKTKIKRQKSMVQDSEQRAQSKELMEEELVKIAIESFMENLEKLRRVVPVETICMHGSPLSKYDNRMLWDYYDYRYFGIIGEPYFDVNFEEVLYLTDTGRRWDGDSVNIRDKAKGMGLKTGGKAMKETKRLRDLGTKSEEHLTSDTAHLRCASASKRPRTTVLNLHSTFDIIKAARNDKLPDKVMITFHPQRWNNSPFPWIRELVWQNIKNIGKRIIANQR